MIFALASLVFVLDRITKIIALSAMSSGQSIEVLPNIFHITLVLNNGTAFGLMKGQNTALAVITAAAAVSIVAYAVTHKGLSLAVSSALGLILGGALGNLLDRIKFGCVVDFFDFRIWPVFNIADSAITVGMIILVIILCTRSS
ncbi:MAG: signal peptidase II [Candidatus Omnitrophica bacterium]|nr:signal peptidase II [Candidatus Omnitrophota bacterium]